MIHETPDSNDGEGTAATIIYGTSAAHKHDPERNARILAEQLEREPNNARTLYYLAREFWYTKEYDLALTLFHRCTVASKFLAERADAWLYIARILWITQRGDDAREACMRALAINANFKEAHHLMAEMSFPENAKAWKRFAALATNQNVLFVRG